jgi:hypothetical protein
MAIVRVLEVPDDRVGRREPIEVPNVPSLGAIADKYKEVEVRPGVKPISFGANRTQRQQGESIIATRKFSRQ